MAKKSELEFANFILKFGQDRVLLDLAEEIVIPAFISRLDRSYNTTKHFFLDVEVLNLGSEENPIICIAGRYVKNTIVKPEQVFDEANNELVKSDAFLPSSPSSVFILILNNHRLIYLTETAYAPNLSDFRKTTINFINNKYHEFINELYENRADRQLTKSQLYSNYERPSLDIIPLSSSQSISDFINQYDSLKEVIIKLGGTNNELDNNDFFKQVRKAKDEAIANTTTITHQNRQDGLSKGKITQQVESALSQGISQVTLKGVDKQGNKLDGSNDNFKLRKQITDIPLTISGIATKGYEVLRDLLEQGTLQVGETRDNIEEVTAKIKQIWNKIRSDS